VNESANILKLSFYISHIENALTVPCSAPPPKQHNYF